MGPFNITFSVCSFTKFYCFADLDVNLRPKMQMFMVILGHCHNNGKFYSNLLKAVNSIKCCILFIFLQIFTDLPKITEFMVVNLQL
jgi:hypothetical protein